MIHVHEAACEFVEDMTRGVVVLESDKAEGAFPAAFEELNAASARQQALKFSAQKGMGSPRINGQPIGPYPVNLKGQSLEHVRDEKGQPLPHEHELMRPVRYRLDVPVCSSLL